MSRSSAQEVLGVVRALRGGGYAYQKKGARIGAIRHTPGQVHVEELPCHVDPEIARTFELDAQKWHGQCEDPAELFGKTGAPPLPERVPEVVLLALGTRINAPIHEKIASAWVLASDTRLINRMSAPREEEITPNIREREREGERGRGRGRERADSSSSTSGAGAGHDFEASP